MLSNEFFCLFCFLICTWTSTKSIKCFNWSGAIVWHGLMGFSVLEEKFAQAVCFLLVDLYLLTFQPEKALHLLAVLEKLTVKDGNSKNGKGEVRDIWLFRIIFIFDCFAPVSLVLTRIFKVLLQVLLHL